MAERCTRIWCVRPVSSRHSSSETDDRVGEGRHDLVAGAGLLALGRHRHAGGLAGRAPDRRVDHAARRRRAPPHQREVAPLDLVRPAAGPPARRRPRVDRATSSSPDVPLSSRCTMPGRSGSPTPAISGYRASRPCTSVPSAVAGAGVHHQARPACRPRARSSSAYTTGTSTSGSAVHGRPRRGEQVGRRRRDPCALGHPLRPGGDQPVVDGHPALRRPGRRPRPG